MTHLRQLMIEELQRRNFAPGTIRPYVHGVEHFSQYFHRRPDRLRPEHIRQYQAMLFSKLKLEPNTVIQRLAVLRFFYVKVLKKNWSIAETPYPRKVIRLPEILSPEEVPSDLTGFAVQLSRIGLGAFRGLTAGNHALTISPYTTLHPSSDTYQTTGVFPLLGLARSCPLSFKPCHRCFSETRTLRFDTTHPADCSLRIPCGISVRGQAGGIN